MFFLRALWSRRGAAILALALVFASGYVARLFSDGPSPAAIVFSDLASAPDGSPIRVEVSGGVALPGVYELEQGDRVVDAIDAAGGAIDASSLHDVNLARILRDGEELVVPDSAIAGVSALAEAGLVNINEASADELDLLPGIGAAYSRRIIDSRALDGPFRTVDELVQRRVLPQATFEQIRALITVSQ